MSAYIPIKFPRCGERQTESLPRTITQYLCLKDSQILFLVDHKEDEGFKSKQITYSLDRSWHTILAIKGLLMHHALFPNMYVTLDGKNGPWWRQKTLPKQASVLLQLFFKLYTN